MTGYEQVQCPCLKMSRTSGDPGEEEVPLLSQGDGTNEQVGPRARLTQMALEGKYRSQMQGLLWCEQTLWAEMADADLTQVKQGMGQWDPGLVGNSDPVTQAYAGQPDRLAGK